jgi:hypothetical protein
LFLGYWEEKAQLLEKDGIFSDSNVYLEVQIVFLLLHGCLY